MYSFLPKQNISGQMGGHRHLAQGGVTGHQLSEVLSLTLPEALAGASHEAGPLLRDAMCVQAV